MPSAVFEPATPATKRPQTYALDLSIRGDVIFAHAISITYLKEMSRCDVEHRADDSQIDSYEYVKMRL
jgi:hypothetical protein